MSHETISLSLFLQSPGALRRERQRYLRTGRAMRSLRAKRLPKGEANSVTPCIAASDPPRRPTGPCPATGKATWSSAGAPSAVGTLVERHRRFVLLFPLPEEVTAHQVRPALTAAVLRLPEQLRRSLTWDQGREMAEHPQFTIDSGIQVFFCDPRIPWQRGTNENPNGLLRQDLPKTTDLGQLGQAALDVIAAELNGRPRQPLGFKTPSQVLAKALR